MIFWFDQQVMRKQMLISDVYFWNVWTADVEKTKMSLRLLLVCNWTFI